MNKMTRKRQLSKSEICLVLDAWAREAGIPTRDLAFTTDGKNTIIIYTDCPGVLIGPKGTLIDKYNNTFEKIVSQANATIKELNRNTEAAYYPLAEVSPVKVQLVEVERADRWLPRLLDEFI